MSCSEIEIMLGRLHQLLRDNRSHLTNYRRFRKYQNPLTPVELMLGNRIEARKKSAELLLGFLLESKAEEALAEDPTKRSQVLRRNRSWWWSWLVRLEEELREEKIFLGIEQTKATQHQAWRDRKLAAWQAELAHKSLRGTEAFKLVSKLRAQRHAHALTSWNDCLERISKVSFPRELLDLVVETTIKSRVPHWRIDQSTSLARVADKAFRTWPKSFGSDMRNLIQQTSARAILQHSLIIMPATFTLQFSLVTPPDAQGSEHLIRHLVLDLETIPRDGTYNRELNRGSQSMASLSSLFPNLKSCTFEVHLAHIVQGGTTVMGSATRALSYRNVKKISNIITLRKTLVEFIEAFLERGPGMRKFIRFAHSSFNGVTYKQIGKLVPVSSIKPAGTVPPSGAIAMVEHGLAACAERIFQEAYSSPYRRGEA